MRAHNDTDMLWLRHERLLEERIQGWILDITDNMPNIIPARRCFHQLEPLRVYLNVTNLKKKGTAFFSLRFMGQEVAEICVNKKNVHLQINKKHVRNNDKWFKFTKIKEGSYLWTGIEAKTLRAHFTQIGKQSKLIQTGTPEHEVETSIIKEMSQKRGKDKFAGKFSSIQPVKLAGCPFQMPTPISGSSGVPVISSGHIDILARRRVGNKVRLSVWELKKPGITGPAVDKAIKQAIIYASSLIKILRSSCGKDWYNLFGFSKGIPEKLDVDAIVAISKNEKRKFDEQIIKYREKLPLSIGNDNISLFVSYYNDSHTPGPPQEVLPVG